MPRLGVVFLALLLIDLLLVWLLRVRPTGRGVPFGLFFVPGALAGLAWAFWDPVDPLEAWAARIPLALAVGFFTAHAALRVLWWARRRAAPPP